MNYPIKILQKEVEELRNAIALYNIILADDPNNEYFSKRLEYKKEKLAQIKDAINILSK
jgi:hypothetical protein